MSDPILEGEVGSLGQYEGEAYVIDEPSDYFEEGGIIVSENPGIELTPKLLEAGAIITDEGGMLCHAAIVARENEIPAIVGAGQATEILEDRDYLKVDVDEDSGKVYRV